MTLPLYLMLAFGLILIVLFFLFKVETVKGKRLILGSTRTAIDAKLSLYFKDNHLWRKYIGGSSLQLLFHFLLHHTISGILFIIKSVEERLRKLKRHNRLIAKKITDGGSHLRTIAKHKEEVALTQDEKDVRNERSLND